MIAERTGADIADVAHPAVRPPTRPVEIGTMEEPGLIDIEAILGTGDEE
jgi:hypothetical protein